MWGSEMSGWNLTWEVSLSTQCQAIFGPLHHPTISHYDTGQGDRMPRYHHLVLGLLGEVGSMCGGCGREG